MSLGEIMQLESIVERVEKENKRLTAELLVAKKRILVLEKQLVEKTRQLASSRKR